MKTFTLLLLSLLLFTYLNAQNGSEPIKVTDMLKIKTAGNISLTKDGAKAVFTVTSIEPDEVNKLDYKYTTQIYTAATDGVASPIQLTYAKEGASNPVWSPDGKTLAFVRSVDNKPQIFLLPMAGGEPVQLTKSKTGASNPKWSPDGKQILFASSIPFQTLLKDSILNPGTQPPLWPSEKPGFNKNENFLGNAKPNPDGNILEVRAYLENNAADKKAIVLK